MKRAIGIIALVVMSAGCAGQNLRSENADLKARVSALETQVADLRAENAKLAAATATPVTIDGLRLEAPKFGELRFTPAAAARPNLGPMHAISIVDNSYAGSGGGIFTGHAELQARPTVGAGAIILGGTNVKITAKSAASTKASTTPATTPQK
jgi:hypothetical protein